MPVKSLHESHTLLDTLERQVVGATNSEHLATLYSQHGFGSNKRDLSERLSKIAVLNFELGRLSGAGKFVPERLASNATARKPEPATSPRAAASPSITPAPCGAVEPTASPGIRAVVAHAAVFGESVTDRVFSNSSTSAKAIENLDRNLWANGLSYPAQDSRSLAALHGPRPSITGLSRAIRITRQEKIDAVFTNEATLEKQVAKLRAGLRR